MLYELTASAGCLGEAASLSSSEGVYAAKRRQGSLNSDTGKGNARTSLSA